MTCLVQEGKRAFIPMTSKVGLDDQECLLDGVEVRGIKGEVNELAAKLDFYDLADFLRMVNVAVLKDENTLRTGVGICKEHDMVLKKAGEDAQSD